MGLDEGRLAKDQLHVVAGELVLENIDTVPDDLLTAEGEIINSDVVLDPVAQAVHLPLQVSGEIHCGFPKGLAGDNARVNGATPHHLVLLHHRNLFAQLGGLDGGAVAARAGANYYKVVTH